MIETETVADLTRQCRDETARYFRREPFTERYCIELFRRAVLQRDEEAWHAIYDQYSGVVRRWLGARTDDDDEDVTAAFERFWRALSADKFARFGSLAAILQYLKMCALTARLDRLRSARAGSDDEPLDEAHNEARDAADVEGEVALRLDAPRFWELINAHIGDARERRILYLSYVTGLTPRDICARHGDVFPDVHEVYRIKRGLLDRLRRVAELRELW